MNALIIAAEGVQDVELVYPYYRLREAGFAASVVSPNGRPFHGIKGLPFEADGELIFSTRFDTCDLLVLPGGVKAMEKLRLLPAAISLVQRFMERGKIVASICSGAQLLISAGVVRNRRIAAYYAMRVDVENAGAIFVDLPAVVDGNLVSSPHYQHLGPWMAATLAEVERNRHEKA